jgi:hypothetical protein
VCWKQEWASAINTINWTIIHIERAQAKLHKRRINNEETKGKILIKGDKWSLQVVEKLILKYQKGEHECKILIDVLRGHQEMLKHMIEDYGISRKGESARLQALMTGQRKVKGKPWGKWNASRITAGKIRWPEKPQV